MTPYTFMTIFLPACFSYYVMAILVQLPRSNLYRAALLPAVFWLTFRANMSLDFSWNYPGYDYLNQALSVSVEAWPGLLQAQTPQSSCACLPSQCAAWHGCLYNGLTLDCRPPSREIGQSMITTETPLPSPSMVSLSFPRCGMPGISW